ncbi:MAG TPA: protein kinase, partial [Myxococcota bacterium]|nr:protein kinase [Myxococcota bacterium]
MHGARGVYTLHGEPIEGGQAQVWRGTDEEGLVVAVKVALPTARFRRAVVEEARSMRELADRVADAHRWFVPVLDEGLDDNGLPFYVMPFFSGTLAELFVPEVELLARLDVLVQACLAVELLHRTAPADRVVVHRDVKPSNFLVRRIGGRWHVALSDFGIAREETFLDRQTRTVMLTQSYAPPEQYLPLRAEPDPSMDVFALASMVFEGVTCARTPRVAARAREWHNELADELVRTMGSRGRLD